MAGRRLSSEVLTMTLKIRGDESRQELQQLGKEAAAIEKAMTQAAKHAVKDWDAVAVQLEKVDKELAAATRSTDASAESIAKLEKQGKKLITELHKIESSNTDFRTFGIQLEHVKKTMDEVRAEIDVTSMSTEELRMEQFRLNMEMKKADPNSDMYAKWEKQMEVVKSRSYELKNGLQKLKAEYDLNDQSIDDLNKRIRMLGKEMNGLNPKEHATRIAEIKEETKRLRDRSNELKFSMQKLDAVIDMNNSSIEKMEQHQRSLNVAMKRMNPGDEKLKKYRKELQRLDYRIKQVNTGASNFKMKWDAFAQKSNDYQTALMAVGAAIYGVVQIGGQWLDGNAKLSDSIADVMKTTGMTKREVKSMMKTFKSFDTRTPRAELLGLARIAGKLGITGKKDIQAFVKEADKINVALSEDLGGDVEETIRQLGKLTETFKLKETLGEAEALNRVGSAINSLGAASTANEGYLVEFAKRTAGIAPAAGISVQNVLGLGATLDQLGQTAEVSGTVFAQVIPNMFKDTATFAEAAGMSTENFSKLLEEDANEAFITLLDGLNGNNEGMGIMVKKLETLGVEGARAKSVLGVLAGNTKLLRDQQKLSNDEFEKGTSLTNEFNIKNNTLAGNLERVQRALRAMFINSAIMKGMEQLVGLMADMTKVPVSEVIREEQKELNILVGAISSASIEEENRLALIKDLQKSYPDFIGNIEAEKVTNEQLKLKLSEVNDEYERKIMIQMQEEEILALTQAKIQKNISIRREEMGLAEKQIRGREGLAKMNGLERLEAQRMLTQSIRETRMRIDIIKGERDEIQTEIDGIKKIYKEAASDILSTGTKTGGGGNTNPDPVKAKYSVIPEMEEGDIALEDFMSDTSGKKEESIWTKYFPSDEEMQADMTRIAEAHNDANITELENEKRQTEALKQERMKRAAVAAEMFGALEGLSAQWAEKQKQQYGEDSVQYKQALKRNVMFKLAADEASAISSLVVAAEGNPLNLVSGGAAGIAQFATGMIRIATNFVSAYSSLQEVNQAYDGRYTVRGKQDGRTYNNVPFVGNAKSGTYGQPTLVGEHGAEVVFAAHDLMKPAVYRHVQAAMQGVGVNQRADGKYSSSEAANMANVEALLVQLIKTTKTAGETKPPLVYQDFEKMKDKMDRVKARVTP